MVDPRVGACSVELRDYRNCCTGCGDGGCCYHVDWHYNLYARRAMLN